MIRKILMGISCLMLLACNDNGKSDVPLKKEDKPVEREQPDNPRPSEPDIEQHSLSIVDIESNLKQAMIYIDLAQETNNESRRSEHLQNALAELNQAYKKINANTVCGNDSRIDAILAKVYAMRGLVNLQLKKPGIALEDLTEAQKCDSKNGIIQYNLASYYAAQKQNDLALRAFDVALSVEKPAHEEITKKGRSFCTELKNNVDLKDLKTQEDFKVILEKHNISCPDLMTGG